MPLKLNLGGGPLYICRESNIFFGLNMLTLSCMEIKTTIGNREFLMYKKYRCLYKHISNSIRNILKWFAAFERVVSLQSNLFL